MSEIKCSNCGMQMRSSELTCSLCGFKRRLDFNIIGVEERFSYEPPVEQWKEELEDKKTFSEESLKEVKEEYKRRKVSPKHNSGVRRNNLKAKKRRGSSYPPQSKPSFLSYVFGIITLISLLSWAYQTTGISINGNKSPYALKVGECVNDLPSEDGNSTRISSVKTVPCTESHNWEVIYVGTTEGNLIKESTRDAYVDDRCSKQRNVFLAESGVSLRIGASELGSQYILPSEESWLQGDRFFSCMLGDSAKMITGTLRNVSSTQTDK